MLYQYRPLLPRQIRLISVLPGKPFELDIIHTDLDTAPDYVAVSYTCGTASDFVPIKLGDSEVLLSHTVVHAIELASRYKSVHYLWADVACIDQCDNKERASQVGLIREIYERARMVVADLGIPQSMEVANLGSRKIRELFYGSKDLKAEDRTPVRDMFEAIGMMTSDAKIYSDDPNTECNKAWQGIDLIYKSAYWTRTWTVQESSIPNFERNEVKVLFHYGEVPLSWQHITFTMVLIDKWRTSMAGHPFPKDFVTVELPIKVMEYRNVRAYDTSQTFVRTLASFRLFEALDPRDKVFVPLGLASDVTADDIPIDYDRPVHLVYLDTAAVLSRDRTRPLDFLGLVIRMEDGSMAQKGVNDLPTWILDWSHSHPMGYLLKALHYRAQEPGPTRIYKADGGITSHICIDGLALALHGFCFDTVADITRPIRNNLREALETAFSWSPKGSNWTFDLEHYQRVFRTLKCDVELDAAEMNVRGSKPLRVHADDDLDAMIRSAHLDRAETYMRNRRICFTEKGFLALVPAATRIGDRVAVLLGGQVLYVLRGRPEEDVKGLCSVHGDNVVLDYEFVGECYVEDMMDGQAMALPDSRSVKCIRLK